MLLRSLKKTVNLRSNASEYKWPRGGGNGSDWEWEGDSNKRGFEGIS